MNNRFGREECYVCYHIVTLHAVTVTYPYTLYIFNVTVPTVRL